MRDPADGLFWIDEQVAVAIHGQLLAGYGGPEGTRSADLLASALARPRQHLRYAGAISVTDLAAVLTAGIVRNHPFVDGNKRTGFVLGVMFLELNGFRFEASQADAAHAVLELAAGTIDEATYGRFLVANSRAMTI